MWHFTRLPLSHCSQSLLLQVNYCTLTNDSYPPLAWPDAAMGHDDILLASWPKSSLEKQWKWQNQTQTTKTQVHFSSQEKDKEKMFRGSCGFFALLLKCLVSVQTVLETTVRTRAIATPLGNRESARKVVSMAAMALAGTLSYRKLYSGTCLKTCPDFCITEKQENDK